MPCQWIVEVSGRRLSSVMRIRSPAVARISGPGRLSPYAQVETALPPRSNVVGAAVRVWVTTFWPAFGVREGGDAKAPARSEEHTSELQSRGHHVCRRVTEKQINKRHIC